ncbi:MAG: beta-N-acetylhexosaminidase [Gammaproteobacteria bacterium]
MSLGPLMVDVEGVDLTPADRDLLAHPAVGGVILFSRNYDSPEQLRALTAAIHAVRTPPLLVAVDQEGGRVQRFREGFTALPAVRWLGRRYDADPEQALRLARHAGWLLAAELGAAGVDFSFAPVVDLDWGLSEVIGDRAFHGSPEVVGELASAFVHGMQDAGMAAVAKHWPGHGAVVADSHHELPVDRRSYADIMEDMKPFERLVRAGVPGIMTAHVVYSEADPRPATFSPWWVGEELRGRLGFDGAIFSDDLSMKATESLGSMSRRARAALEAGCDMVLVCNDRDKAAATAERLGEYRNPPGLVRLARFHGRGRTGRETLLAGERWQALRSELAEAMDRPVLELDA